MFDCETSTIAPSCLFECLSVSLLRPIWSCYGCFLVFNKWS